VVDLHFWDYLTSLFEIASHSSVAVRVDQLFAIRPRLIGDRGGILNGSSASTGEPVGPLIGGPHMSAASCASW